MNSGVRKFIDYTTGVIQKVSSAAVQPLYSKPASKDIESMYAIIQQILGDTKALLGNTPPGSTDFFNVTSTASPTTFRFIHNYGCKVRYSFLDIDDTSMGGLVCVKNSSTDENTLVLDLYFVGTLTVRIEPAV